MAITMAAIENATAMNPSMNAAHIRVVLRMLSSSFISLYYLLYALHIFTNYCSIGEKSCPDRHTDHPPQK